MATPNLLPGTLDVLILKAISLGTEHGYGLLLRIQRMSRQALVIEQGRSIRRSSGSSDRA